MIFKDEVDNGYHLLVDLQNDYPGIINNLINLRNLLNDYLGNR